MFRHILRRLLLAIPTLIVVVTIIFFVVRVIPGDAARAVLALHDAFIRPQPASTLIASFTPPVAEGDCAIPLPVRLRQSGNRRTISS